MYIYRRNFDNKYSIVNNWSSCVCRGRLPKTIDIFCKACYDNTSEKAKAMMEIVFEARCFREPMLVEIRRFTSKNATPECAGEMSSRTA